MFHDCKDHLHTVNESYFTHMGHAARFGLRMIGGGIGAIIHGIFPALYKYTASDVVSTLHTELQERRARAQTPPQRD